MERHYRVLEQLAKDKQEWYEEVKCKDPITKIKEQLAEANQDINMTNISLIQLKNTRTPSIQNPWYLTIMNPLTN